MQLSATLSWLVDAASETAGADRLLAELGAHLIADGLPHAGGALSLPDQRLKYFVLLAWVGERVTGIRDFVFAHCAMDGAELAVMD